MVEELRNVVTSEHCVGAFLMWVYWKVYVLDLQNLCFKLPVSSVTLFISCTNISVNGSNGFEKLRYVPASSSFQILYNS